MESRDFCTPSRRYGQPLKDKEGEGAVGDGGSEQGEAALRSLRAYAHGDASVRVCVCFAHATQFLRRVTWS